jgi:Holliday junction resolvasome RuvABC endonuclease subunit
MFVAFRRFLEHVRREHGSRTHGFAAVAYELPFARGSITSRILWGMAAHMQERAAVWGCRVLPVNTMTLKKFATGSGKAQKADMITMAQVLMLSPHAAKLGEHEADAIHVARWGWATFGAKEISS